MAGYTRQDTTGQLANGNPIDADIFNDEYDAIEGAFNASTGHTHDGTAGGGAPIESIGPSQELEVTSAAVFPKNNNLIDHGKTALRWKDGYYGGTVYAEDAVINDDVSIGGDLTVTGNATIAGNLTFGDAATDTVDFQADIDSDLKPEAAGYNLGSYTQEWNNLWIDGTANVDTLTVDENGTVAGTFDVTGAVGIDGDFDINTNKFTVASATGNTAIAGTLDVTGASTLTGAVTATGGVTGDLTGDVTGNVTGDVTGNVTGNLTGDVTGNVSGNVTGDLTGDVYASNGTSKVLESGTDGTDATFTGDVTGDVTGNISGNLTGNVTSTGANTMGSLTTTGNVGVGGDVTVTGDLTVQGTTTTVNSTTVDIADLNITVASGAATAAAANGGGLTVAGASATLTYDSVTDRWDMNKDLEVTNVYADLTGDVKASDGTTVLASGNGVTPATFVGSVDGIVGGTTPAAVTGTTIEFDTGLTDGTTTITGFVDEDDMVSNSDTKIPTQQSVKAYVDAAVAGDGTGDIEVDTVDATTIDLGSGTGWTIAQSGTELHFSYNGTVRFKMTSTGTFKADDDVEAASF